MEMKPESLKLNVVFPSEIAAIKEGQPVVGWYKERVSQLPEMKVIKAPATDGKSWTKIMTTENEVDEIKGAHFTVEGTDIVSTYSWHQLLINQASSKVETKNNVEIMASGIVLLISDQEGRIFLTVQQEPGMDAERNAKNEEIHPAVRTPIQTSVVKLEQLAGGKKEVDPVLNSVLESLAKETGKSLREVTESLPLSRTSTDANRMRSNVYYGVVTLENGAAAKLKEQVPSGRWCTKEDVAALALMGVNNGHLQIALQIKEAQQTLGYI